MVDPIREFWRWWPGTAPLDSACLDRRVHAMDAGLGWELSGRSLVVHSQGDPTLRALAARWAAAALAADGWTFLGARPPSRVPLSGTMLVDGVRVDLALLRFAASPASFLPEIDVTGMHPAFGKLSAAAAARVTMLALDDVLGETWTDLWIGQVTGAGLPAGSGADSTAPAGGPTTTRLRVADGVSAQKELLRLVDDFAAQERWQGWTRIGDAAARWPLRPARWPCFDLHLAVIAPPQDLAATVGTDGAIVAWEDAGRIAHVYADGATDLPARVEAAGHAVGSIVERAYDPAFAEVGHLATAQPSFCQAPASRSRVSVSN